MKGFAKLAQPLTDLTRKENQFIWTDSCTKAFKALKAALVDAPCLNLFDPECRSRVVCDAS